MFDLDTQEILKWRAYYDVPDEVGRRIEIEEKADVLKWVRAKTS